MTTTDSPHIKIKTALNDNAVRLSQAGRYMGVKRMLNNTLAAQMEIKVLCRFLKPLNKSNGPDRIRIKLYITIRKWLKESNRGSVIASNMLAIMYHGVVKKSSLCGTINIQNESDAKILRAKLFRLK
ncbi:MAG: hypothetical protein EOO92_19850 [Pedobacter sp.]|nr:MAG: hypothetical protein EOO92_19850 [Pedobacter sp.]